MAAGASTLKDLVESVMIHRPIDSFQGPWKTIEVIVHSATGANSLSVSGLNPYNTLEDIQRAAWLASNKSQELYPKYTYFAYEDATENLVPAIGIFKEIQEDSTLALTLPDPAGVIRSSTRLDAFVDSEGEKKEVSYAPRGRATIEEVFGEDVPVFHAFPLRYLLSLYRGQRPISTPDWNSFFYPYFPALDQTATGELTTADVKQSENLALYITTKIAQNELVAAVLEGAEPDLKELKTTEVRALTFQWTEQQDVIANEGVDTLFFSAPVSDKRPYLRLLMPNATPLTKLYQPDPFKPPMIHDAILLRGWVNEPSPMPEDNVLIAKVPLREDEFGLPPLYGTLRLLDDMTADFVIQPPKETRYLDAQKDLYNLHETLQTSIMDLLPTFNQARLGRAAMTVELRFQTLPPRDIRKKVAQRLDTLSTFFQRIEPPSDDTKPFLSLRYKAVSNFVREDRIASYLTYMISRRGLQPGDLNKYTRDLAKEFQITEDEALQYIGAFINDSTQMTTVDSDGKGFMVLNHPGIDVSLVSKSATTFGLQLYNMRAVTTQDIQRLVTLISMAFYGSDAAWDIAKEPSAKAEAATDAVEKEEKQEEQMSALAAGSAAGGGPQGRFVGLEEVEDLGELELNLDAQPPLQEEQASAIAAVEKKAAAKQPAEAAADEEDNQQIIAHQWFITQLAKLDPVLFVKDPKYGKTQKDYTAKCAANEDRQPAILTRQQFQDVLNIYSRSDPENPKHDYINKVGFIVYGEKEPNPYTVAAAEGKEVKFTVLRYGSDSKNPNYYICSRIFCLKDLIPILEDDWKDTEDFNGERKPAESCPKCHGREIKNRRDPEAGQTVIIRKNKPKATKAHVYVGFVKDSGHPLGYELPCCFVSEQDIAPEDNRFRKLREEDQRQEPRSERLAAAAEARDRLDDAYKGREQLIVPFDVLAWKLPREYVLGPERYPLEPGKIGMPSLAIDKYFGQVSTEFVERATIRQEFTPNVNGFFRLGVMNKLTTMNQSLFAALGPLLGKNTIGDIANFFADMITPRVFMNLNFGNLLLEFFDPADKNFPRGPKGILRIWAKQKFLSAEMSDFELSRLYRSYHRFIRYIRDDAQKKQLRHFAHALAEPGLLTSEGLTIVTLHYKGDPRALDTDVEVLCPMLGFDTERYANNNIAYLSYSDYGIWEPLVYVGHLSTTVTARKSAYYKITQADLLDPEFPPVAKQRYLEFTTTCRSSYRGAFTIQQGIESSVLLPVSVVLNQLGGPLKVTGVVRDSYNHLIAITVTTPIEGRVGEVLVPVVDDGYSFHDRLTLKIYLTLDSVPKASALDVEEAYAIITERLSNFSAVYTLNSFVATSKGIIGFTIGTGETALVKMPCGPLREGDAISINVTEQTDSEFDFEYMLDREIQVKASPDIEPIRIDNDFVITKKQIDEIYEHLRLSFANWIATAEGTDMRQFIDRIINDYSIPKYERIRRLGIEYGPTIMRWFKADDNVQPQQILLRSDCLAIRDPTKCVAACKYDNGTCKIHTPKVVQVRSTPDATTMDSAKYFALRLFDEIVRLPVRRYELLNKGVKRVQIPATNIHVGNAWILPENVPAWYDLLREGYNGHGVEQPRYYEEFSRPEETQEEQDVVFRAKDMISLKSPSIPDTLKALFPQTSLESLALKLVGEATDNRLQSILQFYEIDTIEAVGDSFTVEQLTEMSKLLDKPVVQISVGVSPPSVIGRVYADVQDKLFPTAAIVIVPDLPTGPAAVMSVSDDAKVVSIDLIEGPLKEAIEAVQPKAAVKVIRRARRPQQPQQQQPQQPQEPDSAI